MTASQYERASVSPCLRGDSFCLLLPRQNRESARLVGGHPPIAGDERGRGDLLQIGRQGYAIDRVQKTLTFGPLMIERQIVIGGGLELLVCRAEARVLAVPLDPVEDARDFIAQQLRHA